MSKFEQWTKSKNNVNFQSGCSNDCKYCYAKGMSVRYGRSTEETWKNEDIRLKDIERKRKRMDGLVGFPTSHDITRKNVFQYNIVLEKLLEKGNNVLIITKPDPYCIEKICNKFKEYKDNILFRFTIGAISDDILGELEPGAPKFKERFKALRMAYIRGFNTSVSMEPVLEKEAVFTMIKAFKPMVTDKIWLGKMNHQPKLMEKYESIATKDDMEALKVLLKDEKIVEFKE